MVKVSIIVPVYNPGPYLLPAVESVMAQTYQDFELIIVDDGSPEDVAYIAERFPMVRLIRQENAGQAVARNVGIAQSSGEYIAFLDQDDIWLPTKLERQVAALDTSPEAALCYTQFEFIGPSGERQADGYAWAQSYAQMLEGDGICSATLTLVRRVYLPPVAFDTALEPAEDCDLWLHLVRNYGSVFIPTVEAQYRRHGTNQTRRYRDTHDAIIRILTRHEREAKRNGDKAAADGARAGRRNQRRNYACHALDQARQSLRENRPHVCARYLHTTIVFSPSVFLQSLLTFARHRLTLKCRANIIRHDE